MIPETKHRSVESTLVGEDVAMKLDETATAHLMSVLTDLYTDPELAAIREYATNAADAHVEAGIEQPIEVELPTAMRPTFVVRDFGPGLDGDDIRRIYSKYGASTKRATNEQSGVLGLGCKSALTYTDQFTVEGRKNGVKTVVSVSRNEDGGGTMKVLEERAVPNLASGVTITVPVARANEFKQKADDFFAYWQPGTVLVDTVPPEPIEGFRLADDLRLFKRNTGYGSDGPTHDVIVMGNVPYPCDLRNHDLARSHAVVAWVDMGAVDFPPSRESIQDTRRSQETMKGIVARVRELSPMAVQRRLDEAESKRDALAVIAEADRLGLTMPDIPKWRNMEVPVEFKPQNGNVLVVGDNRYSYRSYQNAASSYPAVPVQNAAGAVWITDYTNTHWTSQMRVKLDAFLDDRLGIDGNGACLIADKAPPHKGWVDRKRVFSWANDIRPWKMPRDGSAAGPAPANRRAGTYSVTTKDDWQEKMPEGDLAARTGALFYTEGSESTRWWGDRDLLFGHYPQAAVAVLRANRVDKFKRLYPNARPVRQGVQEAAESWWRNLGADTRRLLTWTGPNGHDNFRLGASMKMLDPAKVDDPVLREYLETWRERLDLDSTLVRKFSHLRQYLDVTTWTTDLDSAVDKYPLLDSRSGLDKHGILYVNAAYAAENEKEDSE